MNNELKNLISDYENENDFLKKARIAKNIADIYWKTAEFDLSRKYCNDALLLIENIDDLQNDPHIYFDILVTLGISYSIQGNNITAKDYFDQSMSFARKLNNSNLIVKAYINIANTEYHLNLYESALEHYFEAMKISQENNYFEHFAKLNNNIGNVLLELNHNQEALEYFKKSLQEKLKGSNKLDIATTMLNIANLYYKESDYPLSLGYYKGALKLFKEIDSKSHVALSYISLAKIARHKKEYMKAIRYLQQSIAISKDINVDFTLYLSYYILARVYSDINNLVQAEIYYNLLIDNLSFFNDKNILLSFYYNYALYSIKKLDHVRAELYFKKYTDLHTELFSDNLSRKVADVKTRYDYEQKLKEAELYRIKNIALLEAQNENEQQKENLIKLNQSKDTILNIVSHDLKNSIGSIQSALELIEYEKPDDKLKKYLRIIKDASGNAIKLVKDILEASQIEMLDFELVLNAFEINSLILSYKHQLQSLSIGKNIQIVFDLCNEPLNCAINTDKFWQIIHNLISNAIKFSHAYNKVIIKTQMLTINDLSYAEISVIDYGIGIPKDKIPYLFEKFSKAGRKGTSGENSTGLGLSIVKRLVELHSGIISFKTEETKGTEFIIQLPILA